MIGVFNAFAFALLLSSLFALRFRQWGRRSTVALYFGAFFLLELGANHFFIPPGALGAEIGWLCLGLTLPVLVATLLVRRYESGQRR